MNAGTFMPGDRVRLTIEGTCVVGDTEHVHLRLDDGSVWQFFPATAKIEKVTRMPEPTITNRGIWLCYYADGSAYAVFAVEIEALRHAVDHHMLVKFQEWGEVKL